MKGISSSRFAFNNRKTSVIYSVVCAYPNSSVSLGNLILLAFHEMKNIWFVLPEYLGVSYRI